MKSDNTMPIPPNFMCGGKGIKEWHQRNNVILDRVEKIYFTRKEVCLKMEVTMNWLCKLIDRYGLKRREKFTIKDMVKMGFRK